jgi:arsenate reductase (glutaredoxin)
MDAVIMYHNPHCSKSRQTLQLLEEKGVEPEIVEYLKNPPDEECLGKLLDMLGLEPRALMRTKEDEYEELGLAKVMDRQALIRAMVEHPILIERPIVIKGSAARLGRPPEQVLEIL